MSQTPASERQCTHQKLHGEMHVTLLHENDRVRCYTLYILMNLSVEQFPTRIKHDMNSSSHTFWGFIVIIIILYTRGSFTKRPNREIWSPRTQINKKIIINSDEIQMYKLLIKNTINRNLKCILNVSTSVRAEKRAQQKRMLFHFYLAFFFFFYPFKMDSQSIVIHLSGNPVWVGTLSLGQAALHQWGVQKNVVGVSQEKHRVKQVRWNVNGTNGHTNGPKRGSSYPQFFSPVQQKTLCSEHSC